MWWLAALVKGALGAFFQWYAAYDQGRKAQRVKDLEASLLRQQVVDDAARLRSARRVDRKWLHDGSSGDPSSARPASKLPPAPRRSGE